MIPTLGLLVAVYCVARLVQVPLEHSGLPMRWIFLLVVSVPAILAIAALAFMLLASGTNTPLPSLR